MNIYKVATDEEYIDYDTYDSAIVVALNEKQARELTDVENYGLFWVQKSEELTVTLVGKASEEYTHALVLLASFNAG